MKNSDVNNNNLKNKQVENSVEKNNMPENQVPRFRSNANGEKNKVKSEAGFLSPEAGEGDFGSEEARADSEKGNKGHAGNMPNSVAKPKSNKN